MAHTHTARGKYKHSCYNSYEMSSFHHPCTATGVGAVPGSHGDYHDALVNKGSWVVLFLVELSGALSPPAKRHLRWLAARAKRRDRTPYESWAAATFMSY